MEKIDHNQAMEMIAADILVYCAQEEILKHAENLQNIVLDNMSRVED